MAVSFNEIPAGGALRVPLFFAELDATRSNLGGRLPKTLIIGQQLAAGTLTPGVPVLCQGVPWTKQNAGVGSMLALMTAQYRARDPFGPIYLLPLADDGAGVTATGTLVVTAPPTAAGTYVRRIAGQRVAVALASGMTTAQVATAISAAINAATDLPVTSGVSTGTVTLTARNKGLGGNEITVTETDDPVPTGLAVTITQPSGGTGNPVSALTTALAALPDMDFDFIVMPYTDTSSLDVLKAHMAGRWSYLKMLYGHAYGCVRGTLGGVTTIGLARNDPHVSLVGVDSAPEPGWIWAADIAAAAAVSTRADPRLPLQTVALGVLPPPLAKRWGLGDQNALLFSGIATFTTGDDGTVRIQRLITGFRTNAFGQPDDSLLDSERCHLAAFGLRAQRSYVETTWPRMALADESAAFRPGATRGGLRIVTASAIRRGLTLNYRRLEREGYVQNSDAYAQALVVERSTGNRCRVDGMSPLVPVDQLRQVAILNQLRDAVSVGGAF